MSASAPATLAGGTSQPAPTPAAAASASTASSRVGMPERFRGLALGRDDDGGGAGGGGGEVTSRNRGAGSCRIA